MSCNKCGSLDQGKFPAEINIHPRHSGLRNLHLPGLFVFPSILVCQSCGLAEFVLDEEGLRQLKERHRDELLATPQTRSAVNLRICVTGGRK
jgi:hypothetical protein